MMIDYEEYAKQSPTPKPEKAKEDIFAVADPEGEEGNYQFSVEESNNLPQMPK
jgi:hypothetical protein